MNDIAKRAFKIAVKRGKITKETTLLEQFDAIQEELNEMKQAMSFSTTNKIILPDKYSKEMHEACIKDTLEGELTDTIIALLTKAEMIGMDIEKHIEWNLKYNAER